MHALCYRCTFLETNGLSSFGSCRKVSQHVGRKVRGIEIKVLWCIHRDMNDCYVAVMVNDEVHSFDEVRTGGMSNEYNSQSS